MGQKLVERIRVLTLDAVVNFPGVPTEPSQVLGLPSCCCSTVPVC